MIQHLHTHLTHASNLHHVTLFFSPSFRSDSTDFSVSVWDVRRHYMPYATFTEHTESARGFVWIDKFTLLSAGKDNTLYHHYFEEAVKPMDTANPVAFHFNSLGNLTCAHSKPIKPVKVASSHENLESSASQCRPKSPFRSGRKVSPVPNVAESIVTAFARQDQPIIQFNSDVFNETVDMLSMRWFVETAEKYELTGKSFDELCIHNSEVALSLNRRIIHNIWLIILEIYGSRTRNHSIPKGTNSTKNQHSNLSYTSHSNVGDANGTQSCTVSSTIPSTSEFSGLSTDQSNSVTLKRNQWPVDNDYCAGSYELDTSIGETPLTSSINKSPITTVVGSALRNSINISELEQQLSFKLMSSSLLHPIRHVNGNQFSYESDETGCLTKRSYSLSSNPTNDFIDQSDSDESYVNIMPVDANNDNSILLSNRNNSSGNLNQPYHHRHPSNNSILLNTYSSLFLYGDDEFKINLQDALETLSDLTEGQVEQVTSIPDEAFIKRHNINDLPEPPNFGNVTTPESPIVSPSSPLFSSSSGIESLKNFVEKYLNDSTLNSRRIRKIIKKNDTKMLLKQIFHYLTGESDVQSIVSIIIILGGRINELSDYIDSSLIARWFTSYVDLLHRFELWYVATQVITLSNISDVNRLNQSSTAIKVTCGICGTRIHPQAMPPFICKNCDKDITLCAVCSKTVTGLYVWCGGCSHGGHLSHLHNWYVENTTCPYPGCDHECEYA